MEEKKAKQKEREKGAKKVKKPEKEGVHLSRENFGPCCPFFSSLLINTSLAGVLFKIKSAVG